MGHLSAVGLPEIRLELLLESLVEHTALSVLEGELSSERHSVSVLISILRFVAVSGCVPHFFLAFLLVLVIRVLSGNAVV